MVQSIYRFSCLSFVLFLVASVVGCASANLPADLVGSFEATVKDRRAVKVVLVDWEPRADVHAFCGRQLQGAGQVVKGGRLLGCAVMGQPGGRCTVVTDVQTTYAIFGHEVRHCFDGLFHQ